MKKNILFLSLLLIYSCNEKSKNNNIDDIVSKAVAKAMDSLKNEKKVNDTLQAFVAKSHSEEIKTLTSKELIKLSKKHFESYKTKLLLKNTDIGLLDAYVGDFTNDGKEDVVLYYSIEPTDGGNYLAGQGLALYKNTTTDIQFFKTFDANFLFAMDKINNGKIWIKEMEYTEDDPRCCPSIEKPISLTINGTEIKQKYE